jgi:O-antigen biosynthesis protein
MISVITPSHDPRWLEDTWLSLKAQTYWDFEWIVLLNGDAIWTPPDDGRIVMVQDGHRVQGVGALKREAARHAIGDIILELDHDDLLAPLALEKVARAFVEPRIDFVYSDCAQIDAHGDPDNHGFDPAHGWEYEGRMLDGTVYHCAPAMEPTPHNLSYVWYAPNHLRAWRTSFYWDIGGHDPAWTVCDDHELMCRTYQRTEPVHIPELLYLQRVHHANTQTEVNAQIQTLTRQLYETHIEANLLAFTRRRGLLAYDLGGIHNPRPGYRTLDVRQGADLVADILDTGLPDSCVGVFRAVDFFEHVPDKVALFNELYRLLAPGGMILSATPSTDGRGAFQDPTHVSFFNANSFWYFTNANYAAFVPEITCRFQVSHIADYYPSDWHEQNRIPYVAANLIAVKDGPRNGGLLNI